MSYLSIATCVGDNDIVQRVTACYVQEGGNANSLPPNLVWGVSSKADIEAAYAYALTAGTERPGADETVVTDQMILSAVQSLLPQPEDEP